MGQRTSLARGSAAREEQLAIKRFQREFALERLRAAVRREVRTHGGQRRAAASIRIPRGALRRLVEMRSAPTGRNMENLENWVADRPETPVTGGMVALALLAGELPADVRAEARRHLGRELAMFFRATGVLPAWLHEELADATEDPVETEGDE